MTTTLTQKATTAIAGLLFIGWATFAGAAERIWEDREVEGFHALSASTSGDFRLEKGEVESLSIQARPETLERLKTEVIAGELRISLEDGLWWRNTGAIDVLITYRQLDSLRLSGSAEVKTDALAGSTFEVNITGSADVEVPDMAVDVLQVSVSGSGDLTVEQLRAEEVQIEVRGSGDITLAGVTDQQTVKVYGSGTVDNEALQSVATNAVVSGSGDTIVWASGRLVARISGSGDIRYRGDPELDSKVTGSGEIRCQY